jgi:hypothetical protein
MADEVNGTSVIDFWEVLIAWFISRHGPGLGISTGGAGIRRFQRVYHTLLHSHRPRARWPASCGERCSMQSRLPIEPQRRWVPSAGMAQGLEYRLEAPGSTVSGGCTTLCCALIDHVHGGPLHVASDVACRASFARDDDDVNLPPFAICFLIAFGSFMFYLWVACTAEVGFEVLD